MIKRYTNKNNKGKDFIIMLSINEQLDLNSLSYILAIPKDLEENVELVVESLNFEGTNDPYRICNECIKCELRDKLEIITDNPILIPFVPDVKDGVPYYQQLARECFEESESCEIQHPNVDRQVVECIEKAKEIIENQTGKKVRDKIFLNGYSSSGVFAQRFALIHPEIVERTLIGGAASSIPIPDKRLPYPLGISDYEELFGHEFDIEAYKKIQFAYYVAENEEKDDAWEFDINGNKIKRDDKGKRTDETQIIPGMHDMSYMLRSTPLKVGKRQRKLFGKTMQERWESAIQYYLENGYNISHKIYREAEHRGFYSSHYGKNILDDLLSYLKLGKPLSKDESSAEKIVDRKKFFSKDGPNAKSLDD